MRHNCLALGLIFSLSLSYAGTEIQTEQSYLSYQGAILAGNHAKFLAMVPSEQKLYVDALWDLVDEGDLTALKVLRDLDTYDYALAEKLIIELLRIDQGLSRLLPVSLVDELVNVLRMPEADSRLLRLIAAHEETLLTLGYSQVVDLAKKFPDFQKLLRDDGADVKVSEAQIADLFKNTPDAESKGVKLFMFCRKSREYPCLMAMRDARDKIVRNEDGTLWTHKALAYSAKGLASYHRNGNTPAGVLRIEGVMPVADKQISFGKFRRLILEFIPSSPNERNIRALLPESSQESLWWSPVTTARDIGRNLLRIHGTGRRNLQMHAPYFPFMRTSGCIAQRENTYNNVTFEDQKKLLTALQKAMGLPVSQPNEEKIRGHLYLIEIDDLKKEVSPTDLRVRGIK